MSEQVSRRWHDGGMPRGPGNLKWSLRFHQLMTAGRRDGMERGIARGQSEATLTGGAAAGRTPPGDRP
jgi:hypothetical protein